MDRITTNESSERSNSTTVVELSPELVARVESRLPVGEFRSVDQYVCYVLREVLGQIEANEGEDELTSVDEDEIETRLQALGYLD